MSYSKTLAYFETEESVSYSIGELFDNLLYAVQEREGSYEERCVRGHGHLRGMRFQKTVRLVTTKEIVSGFRKQLAIPTTNLYFCIQALPWYIIYSTGSETTNIPK